MMEKVSVLVIVVAVLFMAMGISVGRVLQPEPRILLNNDRALAPPMGWNSWTKFGCDVSEQTLREIADAMVSNGLHELGYKYINLDDCWGEPNRDSNGKLEPKKAAFPSGMKVLADYLHGKGLKLGLFASAGTQTCGKSMPGSRDQEETDAQTFADWGVDYLKYGNCNNGNTKPTESFPIMTRALRNTGRSIYISLSDGGNQHPATWGGLIANSWRTTGGVGDNWDSMIQSAESNEQYAKYARPGGWNDPDVLVVGNGGMSKKEYIVHFSLWAISKAPLLLSCDLRNLKQDTLDIITNKEVISINQDTYGVQARKVFDQVKYSEGLESKEYHREVWAAPISDYRVAVVLLNRGSETDNITATWENLALPLETTVEARDIWEHVTLPQNYTGSMTVSVESHACKMFILRPIG